MIHLKLDKSYLSILLFIYMLIISNIQNGILSVVAVLFCMCFVNQPQFLLPHLLLTSLFVDYFVAFSGIGMSRIVAVIFIAAVFLRRFKTDAKLDCKSLVVFLALSVFVFFVVYCRFRVWNSQFLGVYSIFTVACFSCGWKKQSGE